MEYTLYRSKRKTIAIIIRDGQLIVRAPHHSSLEEIESFLHAKANWVEKKLSEYRKTGVDENRNEIYVFGKKRKIIYQDAKNVFFEYADKSITINAPFKMSKDNKIKRLELDLKERLNVLIDDYLDKYSKLLNLKKPPYRIRKYKRIHGRCSHQGELAFNTYLYEHSKQFIEYVVLHECAHLIEYNHSDRFYAIIQEHMPEYKKLILEDKILLSPHQDQ